MRRKIDEWIPTEVLTATAYARCPRLGVARFDSWMTMHVSDEFMAYGSILPGRADHFAWLKSGTTV